MFPLVLALGIGLAIWAFGRKPKAPPAIVTCSRLLELDPSVTLGKLDVFGKNNGLWIEIAGQPGSVGSQMDLAGRLKKHFDLTWVPGESFLRLHPGGQPDPLTTKTLCQFLG